MPELSSARARALAAPADALHRLARRSFIKRVVVGGAVLGTGVAVPASRLLPVGASPAARSTPLQADLPDATLARFLQSYELAAAEAHELVAEQLADPELSELAALFGEHHREHADAIGENILVQDAAAGGLVEADEEVLAALQPRVEQAADDTALLEIALELEETLASTHYEVVGLLEEASDARNVGLILPIEAQHAVALATALGRPADQYLFTFQGASPVEPAEISEPPTPEPEEETGGGEDDGSGTSSTTTPT